MMSLENKGDFERGPTGTLGVLPHPAGPRIAAANSQHPLILSTCPIVGPAGSFGPQKSAVAIIAAKTAISASAIKPSIQSFMLRVHLRGAVPWVIRCAHSLRRQSKNREQRFPSVHQKLGSSEKWRVRCGHVRPQQNLRFAPTSQSAQQNIGFPASANHLPLPLLRSSLRCSIEFARRVA